MGELLPGMQLLLQSSNKDIQWQQSFMPQGGVGVMGSLVWVHFSHAALTQKLGDYSSPPALSCQRQGYRG
jgi:hypothetical protein